MKNIETDVLVLGSGIAGLSFAIKAAELGSVCIVTKAASSNSNTWLAQGGIACVWDEKDNFNNHIQDTLLAGDGHCNVSTVETVVKNAPNMIRDLMSLGVHFNKETNNTLELGREGGHSKHRIVHINDESGMAIVNVLLEKARSIKNIRFYEHHFAVDLIKEESICIGAYVLDSKNNEAVIFNSKFTVLATGGAGQVYNHTTNPEIATGDGIAMAYNIGAKIDDMEFVQFHPTALYHPKSNGFLISEALRGFGAVLVLPNDKPFMDKYHPLGSLAPRDIVSRAMYSEMQACKLPCLYLDARKLPSKDLKNKFPGIYQKCLRLGIDITSDLIPVAPAAHYMCGGVHTNINGQTTVNNLFAIGEVACTGLHGANRLASNSLLEGWVFAENAYQNIKKTIDNIPLKKTAVVNYLNSVNNLVEDENEIRLLKEKIRNIMWIHAGIKRNISAMKTAYLALEKIEHSVLLLLEKNKSFLPLLELRNIITSAKIIMLAASKRNKSIGTHFVEDQPILNNN